MPRSASRLSRWMRRGAWATAAVGGAAAAVEYSTDSSLSRSLRAIITFADIAWKYKNRSPENLDEMQELHRGAAQKVLHVCLRNEGLYIKLGQGLNAMSHVLPREYTQTLSVLLDNAPPVPLAEIEAIIYRETGRSVGELFERFDPTPVASASIAQVHRAWLRGSDGGPSIPVAVKVQKPCISTQSRWDVRTYQFLSIMVEKLFGLPTGWSRRTVVDGLNREMDFTIEAANAARVKANFADNPSIYVPTILHSFTTPKLLVMEWIEGTKLLEVDKIRSQYNQAKVLKTLFDAVGDMMFKHGFVHCDPHAANILVRPRRGGASRPGSFEVVLLDFGLCVPETERFRLQYALLFKSLFNHDINTLRRIVHDWGIADAEVFASVQLQKPLASIKDGKYDEVTREEVRAMQRAAHARIKDMLMDQSRIPRELPLVGRGIDILRGINRLYDSPVNRLNMFVSKAVKHLGPLSDYDSVDRYLDMVQQVVKENGGGTGGSTGGSTAPMESVFDDASTQMMREQSLAIKFMEEEQRHRTLGPRIASTYHQGIFYCTLFAFDCMHTAIHWYNTVLDLVLPRKLLLRWKARSLDDRITERFSPDEMAASS